MHVNRTNESNFTNVTATTTCFMILELVFAAIFIVRALFALLYKLKRGWVRKLYDNINYFFLLRCANLILLTINMLKFESQVCFCSYRDWFHDHCYFDDYSYTQYLCYARDRIYSEWIEDAANDFKNFTK